MNVTTDGPDICLGSLVPLMNPKPVVNGQVLHLTPLVTRLEDGWRFEFPAGPSGQVELDVLEVSFGLTLRWRVRDFPQGMPLDDFGVHFEQVLNVRRFLRQGYHSWDGSGYVTPDPASPTLPGYALTQLLPRTGSGSTVLGFDRHDRFQHTFSLDSTNGEASLTVLTLWDRKACAEKTSPDSEVCESERLLLFEHEGVEEGLREWARQVARTSPLPPRVARTSITGWCSWYNLYAAISEENLLEHLHGVARTVRREKLPMQVFQIDDGFTPEMGDWLEVKAQFPRGMKALLDDIRAAGFTPGLWIAPFMVGNRSRLYREHPEWVVRDRLTGGPLVQERFYGEFRWHKRSEEYYILDTTHPGALEYLRQVLRTWRREWGCEYFKTDFMFFGAHHGPDRAQRWQEGQTRIEVWHAAARMIREELGDALWLNCGAPLWASVGLADAVRTGRDVGVEWHASLNAAARLENLAVRNFANQLLWQADPDCVLLREHFHHLGDDELSALALYAGMTGGVLTTSDDLAALSRGRLELWRLILSPTREPCHFPLLGQQTRGVMVQVRGSATTGAAVFFFNTGEQAVNAAYALCDLQLPPLFARSWPDGAGSDGVTDTLRVELAPHGGRLFFLRSTPFGQLPARLPGLPGSVSSA